MIGVSVLLLCLDIGNVACAGDVATSLESRRLGRHLSVRPAMEMDANFDQLIN